MSGQLFRASSTVTVRAPKGDIWALWVDVNGWSSWNDGVAATRLTDNFKSGSTFTLTTTGGTTAEVRITEVAQGEGFTDETVLPFGTLRNHHRMETVGELVQVTHEVEAEIDASAVAVFASRVWPGMQAGLSSSLLELVDLVATEDELVEAGAGAKA